MRCLTNRVATIACGATALVLWIATPAEATTVTFATPGSEQAFTVPAGVTTLHTVLIGGSGGSAGTSPGGVGAQVSASLTVTPEQTLYVEVGGKGTDAGSGGAGGLNGGATGGLGAGGGGGASDIRTSPRSVGLTPDHRLVIAGGGGGAGGAGEAGPGAFGGAAGAEGGTISNAGGGAGTASAGGAGGAGCSLGVGGNGQLGTGGTGASGEASNGGGGGAGGLYGGGGGGGGCSFGGGGGGGGSSLVPAGGTFLLASPSSSPEIRISYSLAPPAISVTSPTNGAVLTQGQAVVAAYSCTPSEGATVTTCAGPVPNGALIDTSTLGTHTFTIKAEDNFGLASTQSVVYNVVAPGPAGPVGETLPETSIILHPPKTLKIKRSQVKVKFGFVSNLTGATFKCKLDGGQFAACASPKTYRVKPGKHKFSVEAIKGGTVDPTPATYGLKVVKRS